MIDKPNEKNVKVPLDIPIIISQENGIPIINLRKKITLTEENKELFKGLLSTAYHELPIIVHPTFTNRIHSIAHLCEKGIIYQKEGQYFFNI